MLEVPTLPGNPIEEKREAGDSGGGGVAVSDGYKAEHGEEGGERNSSSSSRWPREETMALLKIRSEMDVAFRDASPKAPLWEQVSRKLAELGYQRSAKKCREKFENIYKYHRRTKEGRCGKPNNNGKTYRFFEQLEALHPQQQSASAATAPTTTHNVDDVIQDAVPCSVRFPSSAEDSLLELEHSGTSSSSSEESEGKGKKNKKRKVREFLEGLMREVIERQEKLQRKLMEALENCEKERMAREEAWKVEELARIKRERELLARERSISAAKDEAVLALLKKITENVVVQFPEPESENNIHHHQVPNEKKDNNKGIQEINGNNGEGEKRELGGIGNLNFNMQVGSSRWPRDEVEALIRLRTEMDVVQSNNNNNNNNNNNSNKGPLWEEISLAMKGLGYDRSAKRCKEKWENINKYFKRMKEKNRRKPMDSKTCPYYHHLEALYSNKKPKKAVDGSVSAGSAGNINDLKPEELLMHIMESQQQERDQCSSEDAERENMDQNQHHHQGDDNDNNDEDQGGYEQMVDNSPSIPIMS